MRNVLTDDEAKQVGVETKVVGERGEYHATVPITKDRRY